MAAAPLAGLAPAKVNLTLAVLGRREDGYHDLESIVLLLGLADELTVQPADEQPTSDPVADTLEVEGEVDCALADNLVLRAARALRAALATPLPPLAFRLRKRVPVAGGLGGGSSDAATALRLAAKIWQARIGLERLMALAAEIGSDVPFFVTRARLALLEGRGERIIPLAALSGRMGVLLVTPGRRLSTPDVFAAFATLAADERPDPAARRITAELTVLLEPGARVQRLLAEVERLRSANDLWLPASTLFPALRDIRDELERRHHRPFLLSGSGPTLYAFYPSPEEAVMGARDLARHRPPDLEDATICATDLTSPQPAWRTT
ncbi:4-(cytidine 5'-diphospho)-2-C-methyl-D-erythritol kinase [soil metagenome]